MHIVGIDGSSGKHGVSPRLLREAIAAARLQWAAGGTNEMSIEEVVYLWDKSALQYGGSRILPSSIQETFENIRGADAVIFATSVGPLGLSSRAQNFLESCMLFAEGGKLKGKVVGVIAHSDGDGAHMTAYNIAGLFVGMGFSIPQYGIFHCVGFVGKDRAEARRRQEGSSQLGRNIASLVKSHRQQQDVWRK